MSIRNFTMNPTEYLQGLERARPLALVFLAFGWNSRAATVTWVGNASTNWNLAANWSGSSVPATNDSLVFTNAGTAGALLNNDIPAGRTS